jgi:NADPH-dependent 2,4-dienoyl-CoA reductase/sulfur reductase-like enzyme/rhodanese-related sulfurtransferase
MTVRKIVVIGGVAGGASAAARARRTDETADILLFEKGPYISFANCGLPYYIGGEIGDRSALLLQTPESFRARFRVDVRVGHEVMAIDRSARTVRVRNLATGAEWGEPYSSLILAPGATPIRPRIAGIDLPNVFTVRTVPDSDAIRALVEQQQAARAGGGELEPLRAVVVGAGFIGLEMVENLHRQGLAVTLVEKAPQVLPPLDPELAAYVGGALEAMGVAVITGDGIAALEEVEGGGGSASAVRLESGRRLAGDLFVLGLGVRPDTRLATAAGLELGTTGAIKVNDRMQTSDPAIFAAGDAVELTHLVTGSPAWTPLAGPANKQGRVAGANAAGDDLRFPGALGTAIVRVGDLVAAVTGLSEKAARKAGLDVLVSYTTSGDHADYYPGVQEMLVKLIADRATGRLLGAQVLGGNGVDKRTDVFATAMAGGLTVDDLTNLDLAYAPPFGSAKDPAVVAGMMAQNVLRGQVGVVAPSALLDRLAAGDRLQLVDVRESYEYEIGALPGAVNIPIDQLRGRLGVLDPLLPTVVYDQTGKNAYLGARILSQRGFGDVATLSGGYALWPVAESLYQMAGA